MIASWTGRTRLGLLDEPIDLPEAAILAFDALPTDNA